MNKIEQATKIIELAEQAGCHATIEGSWVVWRPALPANLLIGSIDVNTEIAEIILRQTRKESSDGC